MESKSLTNHDFCMKQSANECKGNFSFDCKPDKCSIDKTAYIYFNSLAFTLKAYRSKSSHANEMKKFNDFKSKIINCTRPKYEWKRADFCKRKH